MTTDRTTPRRVVIVGGGIAALEAVIALHTFAADQLDVTVIAPEPEFTLRPLSVATPFSRGHAATLPLASFMAEHGGRFRRAAVLGIDTDARTVRCVTGADEPYDTVILAIGATARPAFTRALTFGSDPLALNGLLADLEQGYSRSVAFIVPKGTSWPLPLYELALMTAEEVWGMNMDDVHLHLVTPEMRPLDVFGSEAASALADLLQAARIELHAGVAASVESGGRIDFGFGEGITVDRVVALPVLDGPRLEGVPSDARGFIPVDEFGRVIGVQDVYAAGDATDQPIKQGGIACQQADVVAAHIAAGVGAAVEVEPFAPVLRGRLLTGRRDHFLRREVGKRESTATEEPLWWPPAKVSSRYLAPYLEAKGLVDLPMRDSHHGEGVEVRMPLNWEQRQAALGVDSLGSL
jgi:sulfide:quinone oxidoreductase